MRNTKIFAFLLTTLLFVLSFTSKADAAVKLAGSSATLTISAVTQTVRDNRAEKLQAYLEAHNSPLAPYATDFVEQADKNHLDWELVAAISGVESYFGQQIPQGSYNGWGWGVYGTNVHYFTSWSDAITVISAGLRNDYMNKWNARTVVEIGHMYAADPNWAYKVNHFINDIDAFSTLQEDHTLSISI